VPVARRAGFAFNSITGIQTSSPAATTMTSSAPVIRCSLQNLRANNILSKKAAFSLFCVHRPFRLTKEPPLCTRYNVIESFQSLDVPSENRQASVIEGDGRDTTGTKGQYELCTLARARRLQKLPAGLADLVLPGYGWTGSRRARKAQNFLMREGINRLIRRVTATEPCPAIRWDSVVRIDAIGTDALGVFEISLVFTYRDGTEATLSVHHRGYDTVMDSLRERFPTIPSNWGEEMSRQPWHVERTLYSAEGPATP
jgi:hypothetical protein